MSYSEMSNEDLVDFIIENKKKPETLTYYLREVEDRCLNGAMPFAHAHRLYLDLYRPLLNQTLDQFENGNLFKCSRMDWADWLRISQEDWQHDKTWAERALHVVTMTSTEAEQRVKRLLSFIAFKVEFPREVRVAWLDRGGNVIHDQDMESEKGKKAAIAYEAKKRDFIAFTSHFPVSI